jgi:type IV pilus assembly protein PilN
MYSLDVNFVKSRKPVKADTVARSFNVPTLSGGDMTPIYIGLGVGLASLALVLAGWGILSAQNSRLTSQVAELDQTLAALGIQEQEIQRVKADLEQIKGQNRALATVFNQIRPWSAILQDIRDRIPANAIQIQSIKQIAPTKTATAPAAAPATAPAAPLPVSGIEISGIARSFDDVNDLLLSLKQSSFLQPTETRIIVATLVDNPVQSTARGGAKLPQVVSYTVQSTFSDAGATQLLRELERKGTLGLVTRIRTLQQRGLIQQ